ncbi:MAG: 2-isopropylmalate synthase [Cenarchaeum symbiont of Oopsacas minuta]|nr:2-isopropylmalate synthase [Cenarchaeum symbiont of Oopsacas minuta]MDI1496369.1 2-isopropylmalate synthase [Cenarchaeum symbiont of Oopsacas minuta]
MKVGKHAGMHGMLAMLSEFNIHPNDKVSAKILQQVKHTSDQGKKITDVELASIATKYMGLESSRKTVRLVDLSVSTGLDTTPNATVTLSVGGSEHTCTAQGVGPVDAALGAIQKITDETSRMRIKKYNLDSISGGSNALCEVTVEVEYASSHTVSARHVGKDIVTTSVEAVLDAINLVMLKSTGGN